LLAQGQSLFQLAAQNKSNPWLLAEINQAGSTWDMLPGEAIFDQAAETGGNEEQVSLISPVIKELKVDPLPIQQGETSVVSITTTQPLELTGSLAGRTLHFFPNGENAYVALQGVHAMADPGIYPFTLEGKLQDGTQFAFEQMVILDAIGYAQEKILGVDPVTLDPANTKPEDDQIFHIISPATADKYWNGLFSVPGYDPNWITSWFGTRRSYNGGPISAFHTGVDYGGGTGLPIKAPAPGVVVFAGPLTVRGNATFIDHGWGVYSGFFHQDEFKVQVGDRVETGQVIGLSGGTGRITGPHLHWEIWVNGVQVNPLTWLEKTFP
jgi:murein DD-endopeptidase MepM/ murein hydrolase activator NlpD